MINIFICTFNDELARELDKRLKLIQKIKNNNKTLYVYKFDKLVYERLNNKEIWISNKLYF